MAVKSVAKAKVRKAHLHSEQFDGHKHAECGAGDGDHIRILFEEDFEVLPRAERCSKCTRYWFPNGQDPI